MKRNLIIAILLCCLIMMFVGCGENTKSTHLCVKCGSTATTTLSGPGEIMQQYGISTSKCKEIVPGVYSAYVCNACTGPVATITPDP